MEKKKIAESIIIRVGGGIREIRRDPLDTSEMIEAAHIESDVEQTDDIHPFHPDLGATSRGRKNNRVN